MGWESFGVVGFDRGPVLQGRTRILHLQYFFKYVLTYSLHLNSYLVTFLHNTICREQLFCPFLLSGSEFLLNMLFNYHLLYFCTALSLIIVSTGSIRWILWYSVRYAAARREIFGVNSLREKQQQLGSPNLQDIFIGGKLLWEGK